MILYKHDTGTKYKLRGSNTVKKLFAALILVNVAAIGRSANAAVVVSVEAAGVQNTTAALSTRAVETFDGFTTGYKGTLNAAFGGGTLHGQYTTTFVNAASQYGGAGGAGKFNYVGPKSVLTILGGPTDYFGLWATSLDGGNTVSFFKAGGSVGTVRIVDYVLPNTFKGNPTVTYAGRNNSQIYAFFNFSIKGGYDRVDLIQNGGGGFEKRQPDDRDTGDGSGTVKLGADDRRFRRGRCDVATAPGKCLPDAVVSGVDPCRWFASSAAMGGAHRQRASRRERRGVLAAWFSRRRRKCRCPRQGGFQRR